VVTYLGVIKPIKWIGRRRLLREATEAWPNAVMPIKVTRSALGVNTPHSDLFLSPGHAVYLDGLLIQVGSLVNGRTIIRQAPDEADALEYFQIELFDHDILYANGAAAETLFAVCDRTLFDNQDEHETLYGSQTPAGLIPFALRSAKPVDAASCGRGCAVHSRPGSIHAGPSMSCATVSRSARKC
jgi:Hint domain